MKSRTVRALEISHKVNRSTDNPVRVQLNSAVLAFDQGLTVWAITAVRPLRKDSCLLLYRSASDLVITQVLGKEMRLPEDFPGTGLSHRSL